MDLSPDYGSTSSEMLVRIQPPLPISKNLKVLLGFAFFEKQVSSTSRDRQHLTLKRFVAKGGWHLFPTPC